MKKKREVVQYTNGVPIPVRPAPTSKSEIARENKRIQRLKALDKRRRYYSSLWKKHEARCPEIEKLQSAYRVDVLRALRDKGRAMEAGLPLVATSSSPITP